MLARDIYRDFYRQPEGPTRKEKIARVARGACVVFAGCALSLALLDAVAIRSIADAREFVGTLSARNDSFRTALREGIESIAIGKNAKPQESNQDNVHVAIQNAPLKSRPPVEPLAGLAAVRSKDAIVFAMASPEQPSTTQLKPLITDLPPPKLPAAAALGANFPDLGTMNQPLKLASLPAGEAFESEPVTPPAFLTDDERDAPSPITAPLSTPPISAITAPIAIGEVPLPRPAPGVPPPSPADLLGLKDDPKAYAKAERCLANAVYFEARSEQVRGQMAVAQVVINRAFSGFYPNDVCAVVYQNASRRLACQFTFACDGKRKVINERGAWARANRIARQTLDGQIYLPEVAKSTHYHASYVHPSWTREMRRLAHYGLHSFYRPYAWGNGAEEPFWGHAALAQAKKGEASARVR